MAGEATVVFLVPHDVRLPHGDAIGYAEFRWPGSIASDRPPNGADTTSCPSLPRRS